VRVTEIESQSDSHPGLQHQTGSHWQGLSQWPYPFICMSIEDVPAGDQVVVIFAHRDPDGTERANWIGRADDPFFRIARATSREWGGVRAHVHAPEDFARANQIVSDLMGKHRPI
jgi:hypothetical protein